MATEAIGLELPPSKKQTKTDVFISALGEVTKLLTKVEKSFVTSMEKQIKISKGKSGGGNFGGGEDWGQEEFTGDVSKLTNKTLSYYKKNSAYLSKRQKTETDLLEVTKKHEKINEKILLLGKQGILNPNQVKYQVKKNKLTEHYTKFIIQNKFFQNVLTGIKKIGLYLMDMAGNWFVKILGFLLLMSILDPDGKMLESILMTLAGIVVWLVSTIIKMLPGIIKIIGKLIFEVFPRIIKNVAKLFEPIFGKGSLLYTFFHDVLPAIFPYLLLIFIGLGAISKVMGIITPAIPLIKGLGGILSKVFGFLKSFGLFIWKIFGIMFPALQASLVAGFAIVKTFFITMMVSIKASLISVLGTIGTFIIPILLIAGALLLIWKFSDKIVGFFESLFDWFKKLSTGGKILVGVLALILFPLTAVALGIYGLAKLFQSIKKIGFVNTMKAIVNWFKELGKRFTLLGSIFKLLGGWIDMLLTPFQAIGRLYNNIKSGMGFMDAISDVGKFFKLTFLKAVYGIGDAIGEIVDYLGAFAEHYADETNRQGHKIISQIARVSGLEHDQVKNLAVRAAKSSIIPTEYANDPEAKKAWGIMQDMKKEGVNFESEKTIGAKKSEKGIEKILVREKILAIKQKFKEN